MGNLQIKHDGFGRGRCCYGRVWELSQEGGMQAASDANKGPDYERKSPKGPHTAQLRTLFPKNYSYTWCLEPESVSGQYITPWGSMQELESTVPCERDPGLIT